MSDAVLHFLPWMRRGLSRLLVGTADAGGVPTAGLATVDASVSLGAETATRQVQVRGPGAVVGLSPSQVLRRYPVSGTKDFERNYFPHVELASPDLPWMFTPATPTADRLLPWLVLVVVEERDGVQYGSASPLPVLEVDEAARELPDLDQAFAWVHVQSAVDPGADVQSAFAATPEAFVARLMAPRRLANDTWYRACLVPSFRVGRLAGLGEAFDEDDVELAWIPGDTDVRLPVYDSWRFRTAAEPGDFETLVRRLTARTLEGDVGVHALDVGDPGSTALPLAPGITTGFVGALVSPNLIQYEWESDHRKAFELDLRAVLNDGLAATGEDEPADYDPLIHDPAVAPPAYGALPAQIDSVPQPQVPATSQKPRWLSEANLDPAQRATAGLGAEVVRRNQESLVAAAWAQSAAVREANALLNRTRLALEVGKRLKARVQTVPDGRLVQLTSGAHHRLKGAGQKHTVRGHLAASAVSNGLVSAAFRRRFQAGTTISKAQANSSSPQLSEATFCGAVTRDFVEAPLEMLSYSALTAPVGIVKGAESDEAPITAPMLDVASKLPVEIALGTPSAMTAMTPVTRTLGTRPITRSALAGPVPVSSKPAALSPYTRWVSPLPVAPQKSASGTVELTEVPDVIRTKLDPEALLRVRVRHIIQPASLLGDEDVPAGLVVDPQFPGPMVELLVRIDPELLMPGVGSIPTDTVALALLEAAFVEAFLLGANHELGREFLWREYPADPADTWLRTFWNSVVEDPTSDSGAVEDIPRVAQWDPPGLGTHTTFDPDQVLALIVKGDLLDRYPNTLIYAVQGSWEKDPKTGAWERVEDPTAEPLWPAFVGSVGSDVTFLGFQFPASVAVDEDVVGTTAPNGPQPGWFFVFEELPTEPRFGMDEGKPGAATKVPARWENLNWYHALGQADPEPAYVDLNTLIDKNGGELKRRYDADGSNTWRETWGTTSAAMARITLQRPVRMLVHADQMLRPAEAEEDSTDGS